MKQVAACRSGLCYVTPDAWHLYNAAMAGLPLVIGTRNRKKASEIVELLVPWGIEAVSLQDIPQSIDVEETGDTFAANAALKACEQAIRVGHWVLADDSGLEVDALSGKPGVYSARFAGPNATDEENNLRLLHELADLPLEHRTANYVCHITLSDPNGEIRAESHEICRGRIRFQPVGTNGFGYDPLFEVIEYHRTFGNLGPHVKRTISHRARAMRAILPQLVTELIAAHHLSAISLPSDA